MKTETTDTEIFSEVENPASECESEVSEQVLAGFQIKSGAGEIIEVYKGDKANFFRADFKCRKLKQAFPRNTFKIVRVMHQELKCY